MSDFSASGRRGGPGALTQIDRWGTVDPRCRPLSTQVIYAIVEKRVAETAVANLSPHDFRHTVVGDILDDGHDLATVQQLAGHASPVTTARDDRYCRVPCPTGYGETAVGPQSRAGRCRAMPLLGIQWRPGISRTAPTTSAPTARPPPAT